MRKLGMAAAVVALLWGCAPKSDQPPAKIDTGTPLMDATVGDDYLQGFSSSNANADAESTVPDVAADEALVLADRVVLASAQGGTEGPNLRLSAKVRVLTTEGRYTKVQTGEQTGWVPTGALVQNVRRAVLKSDGPDGWPRFTVIGFRPIEGSDTVQAFAAGTDEPRTTVLDRKILSLNANDISLIVFWRLAELETDTSSRIDLLNQGLARYSASSFATMVQDKVDAMAGKTEVVTTPVSLIVSAIAETKVWPEPAVDKGAALETLSAGNQVQVVEQSELLTVDGKSGRWYKIADPAGWVFSTDVQE